MAKNEKQNLLPQELSSFCTQVAMMLDSGIVLYVGMEALAKTYENTPSGAVYAKLSEQVTMTGSLYAALVNCGGFPSYLTEMVGIGERTGRLESVMKDLAAYYERESRIRGAIRSAVTYPVVLGVMMMLIILVMILKVLPVFRSVLSNLGVSMTDSGSVMMRAGLISGWIVLALMAALVIAVLVCCALMKTGAREKVVRTLTRLFPPVERISARLSSARVASALSMMLSSGFPLSEALEMTPSVLEDEAARERVAKMKGVVEEGGELGEALTGTGLFDEMSNCIIRTGCAVGRSDLAMEKVAKDYESRAEESIDGLVSIIEPTLVGVLSVIIGAILLSVMLPMAGIISSIL